MHHGMIPNSKKDVAEPLNTGRSSRSYAIYTSVLGLSRNSVYHACMQDGYKCPTRCEEAIIIATEITLTCLVPYVATRQDK